jgi:hypothetical protein
MNKIETAYLNIISEAINIGDDANFYIEIEKALLSKSPISFNYHFMNGTIGRLTGTVESKGFTKDGRVRVMFLTLGANPRWFNLTVENMGNMSSLRYANNIDITQHFSKPKLGGFMHQLTPEDQAMTTPERLEELNEDHPLAVGIFTIDYVDGRKIFELTKEKNTILGKGFIQFCRPCGYDRSSGTILFELLRYTGSTRPSIDKNGKPATLMTLTATDTVIMYVYGSEIKRRLFQIVRRTET